MLQTSNDEIAEQLESLQKEKKEVLNRVEEMRQEMDQMHITKKTDKQRIDQLENQVSDIALENEKLKMQLAAVTKL